MTEVANSLIELDERGRAWVKDANTKVIEIAIDEVAHGWTPQQMHEMHPHLSLAQIHAALSYYHEHKAEFDAEMERIRKYVEEMRRAQPEHPFVKRMREEGRLK